MSKGAKWPLLYCVRWQVLVCLEQFTHQVLMPTQMKDFCLCSALGFSFFMPYLPWFAVSWPKAWSTFSYLQINSNDRLKLEAEIFLWVSRIVVDNWEFYSVRTFYWDGQVQCSMLTMKFLKNVIVDEETGKDDPYWFLSLFRLFAVEGAKCACGGSDYRVESSRSSLQNWGNVF